MHLWYGEQVVIVNLNGTNSDIWLEKIRTFIIPNSSVDLQVQIVLQLRSFETERTRLVLLHVVVEVSLCRKRTPTSFNFTVIRFLSSVNPHVGFQVSLLVKSLEASFNRANEWFFACMLPNMGVKFNLLSERFGTPSKRTFERFVL